jgi:hypothetical protein
LCEWRNSLGETCHQNAAASAAVADADAGGESGGAICLANTGRVAGRRKSKYTVFTI